ncbi:MAG TPA: glycosyltransferase family 2 protein [Cytophagaceae bacterium]|jgi:GT2 family glycosyltransferase|nr:glycosyltransferase family 2 protein [Cytophagaceae bacterium]
MVRFDLVFVTYNSSKWVKGCFESILRSNFDLAKISIYVTDNNSSDDTVELLEYYSIIFKEKKAGFEIIKSAKNLGFGKGCNLASKKGTSPYLFFLNIDTTIDTRTLSDLETKIEASDSAIGAWELRQYPSEHPKIYDPITGYTSWCSAAALVVRRSVFEGVKGFDKNIFMYAEDVDLSWKIKCLGFHLMYLPDVKIHHYCYQFADEVKPLEYTNSILNNLLLRFKFGSLREIIAGHISFFLLFICSSSFKNSKRKLLTGFLSNLPKIVPFVWWKITHWNNLNKYKPSYFAGWHYSITRMGVFHANKFPGISPLISIIVRTCGRPLVLRETLLSLRNQTYKNIEIVVVEDGENTAENLIKKEFNDLNIVYYCSGKKTNRCSVGNIGMEKAKGIYLNFLDDDDLFYADHIETLVEAFEQNPEIRIAYNLAFESPIDILSKDPYHYKEQPYALTFSQEFNKALLCHHNFIPIQCVMFKKELFIELGGLDEQLEVLEDWDLWLRYSTKDDFYFVKKTCSIYRVPSDKRQNDIRHNLFIKTLPLIREKQKFYHLNFNGAEVAKMIEEIDAINDRKFIPGKKLIKIAMKKIAKKLTGREAF